MDRKHILGQVDPDNSNAFLASMSGSNSGNLAHDFPSRLVIDVDQNLHLYTAVASGCTSPLAQGREVPFIQLNIMSEHILDEAHLKARRTQVVQTAKRMLSGQLNFLEGARQLAALQYETGVRDDDPDFRTFVGIASESDDFPLGQVREEWSTDVLARLQPEIDRVVAWARTSAGGDAACHSLVSRFDV
jgi:hypothetical protein